MFYSLNHHGMVVGNNIVFYNRAKLNVLKKMKTFSQNSKMYEPFVLCIFMINHYSKF